jgi:hypothetical protein
MADTLTIVQSSDDCGDPDAKDVFAINDFFENIPVKSIDEPYETIATSDFDPIAGLPLFDLVWPRFASSFNAYNSDQSGLAHLIVLYQKLDCRIDERGYDQLDCRGVDEYYVSLIQDFAANEGVDLRSDVQPPSRPAFWAFLNALGRLLLVLVDHVLTLLASPFLSDVDPDAEVLFVPHLNRFDSMKPVIDEATYPYQVVLPVTTLEWIRAKRAGRWAAIQPYDPVPVSRFITPRLLLGEVALVVRLAVAELVRTSLHDQLASRIESEYGIRLDRSISHSLAHVYRTHFSAIPNLPLAEQLFTDFDPSSVVIGALSLRSQTFAFAADRQGVAAFHVPHTVTLRQEQVPKTSITHIVASEIAKEYLEEDWWIPEAAEIKAIGRARLGDIAEDRTRISSEDDGIKIVAATQPYEDRIRREFIRTILKGAAMIESDVSVVVKIHPNETTAFYDDVVAGTDINVSVTGDNLRHHLTTADLTCIINTNVGMESMVLGTPTVSINFWSPRTPIRPYMEAGPIPVLETPESAAAFFEELDAAALQQLRDEQIAYVDEYYLPWYNVATEVVDYVNPMGDDSPSASRSDTARNRLRR